MSTRANTRYPPRILGVFAHPDDESFCAGGTFAKYAQAGAEIMVVSATRGDAGQIRDGRAATRRTLGQVREHELELACKQLGIQHAVCLDYGDGKLKDTRMRLPVAAGGGGQNEIKVGCDPEAPHQLVHILVVPGIGD